MLRSLFVGVALLLCSCAPTVSPQPVDQSGPAKVDWQAAQNPEQCARIDGDWRPVCMMGKPACVVKYADAGKSCSDSSECSGRCVTGNTGAPPETAVIGQCTATSDPCGCFQLVEDGKAGYPLCAD